MNGLHSCKPGNEPVVGQVKTFSVIQMTGKSGKPYTKIKSAPAEQGGQPYRITKASPTGHTDSYGNVSFNLEIEPSNGAAPTPTNHQQQQRAASNGDDRSSRIERQHSQSAALAYCAIKGEVPDNKALRALIDWFERDIDQSIKLRPAAPPTRREPEPEPEYAPPSDDVGDDEPAF